MKNKILLGLGMALIFLFTYLTFLSGNMTGLVASASEGCCTLICQQTAASECPGSYLANTLCTDIPRCNVGCCIDTEGYCLSNYLAGNCAALHGTFIASQECLHSWQCISPPKNPIIGFTGYPLIFENTHGIPSAEPLSGISGTLFTIKTFIFDHENVTSVRANLSSEDYSYAMALYDDGQHGDGNADDGMYSAIWQSNTFPSFDGILRVNFSVSVDGENATSMHNSLFLTSSNCLPFTNNWHNPAERKDIIFLLSGDAQTYSQFESQTANIFGQMNSMPSFQDSISSINFYRITKPLQQTDAPSAITQQECPFYDPLQDTVFFLNQQYGYCRQEGNAIEISPSFVFNRTKLEQNGDANDFLEHFCDYVFSYQQLQDMQQAMQAVPNVTIQLPENNAVFTTSSIPINFTITDNKDTKLYYEVYLDINMPLLMLYNGTAGNGTEENITLDNISDGRHYLWIESIDSDGNYAESDVLTVDVDVAGFVITINSLDPLWYSSSPDIYFTITHASEPAVEYILYVDAHAFRQDTALIGVENVVNPQLAEGNYTIQIISKDGDGHSSASLPYIISIGGENPY